MADLAILLSAQALEMWSHLPPDEIDDDEELEFRQGAGGKLMVRTRFACYALVDGRVWRWRPTDDVGFLEVFQNGSLIRSASIAEEAAMGPEMSKWN